MSEQTSTPRRFGFAAIFVAAVLGLIGGGFATVAAGHAFGGPPGFGMGMGGFGHWRGHRGMEGGPIDAEHAKRHAERMVDHLAWAVDATAEQKQKLTQIADGIAADMLPLHQKLHAAHERAVQLLRDPKTDRAALEAFRVEQMALAEEASKRLTQGIADAADVLTPAQRAKLASRWNDE
jgi:periplasmic protein CpxP/Spy